LNHNRRGEQVMSRKLREFRLFRQKWDNPTVFQIILWWESRRIAYNLIVLAVSIMGILILVGAELLYPKIGLRLGCECEGAIFAILGYAVMANICYTGGEILQLIQKRKEQSKAKNNGEISFLYGLLFSVLLTFLPVVLIASQPNVIPKEKDIPGTYISDADNVNDVRFLILEPSTRYYTNITLTCYK